MHHPGARHIFLAAFIAAPVLVSCGALLDVHDPLGHLADLDAGEAARGLDAASIGDAAVANDAAESGDATDGGDAADVAVDGNGDVWATSDGDGGIFAPTTAMFFADVNGDGRADLIGVEQSEVLAWLSDGSRFVPSSLVWLHQALTVSDGPGATNVYFADVTGDGKADAIHVKNDAIYVFPSLGNGFGPGVAWTSGPFFGNAPVSPSSPTQFADVNGDRKADVIAINNDAVYVSLSDGTVFKAFSNWTGGRQWIGNYATAFADLDGDGKADVIGSNGDAIHSLPSDGSSFAWGPNDANYKQLWTPLGFHGVISNSFADVNADGRADAVAVGGTGINVLLSDAKAFVGDLQACSWTTGSFVGQNALAQTTVADVNGDGRADAIAVDALDVRVRLSNGTSFVGKGP